VLADLDTDNEFSVFQPDVIKADLSRLGNFVVFLIERELRSEGLPVDTFGPLEPDKVVIGLTADRSVLGCMNEMAYASRVDIAIHGGLFRRDAAELNRRLRRDIHSPRGYERPIDIARRHLPALHVVSSQRDDAWTQSHTLESAQPPLAELARNRLTENGRMQLSVGQVRARREAIGRILESAGATNPRLFGSVVRGVADEESDVDILIEFREPGPQGFAYFGALDRMEHELGRLLGAPVHVSVVDPDAPAGRRILAEAVPL